MYVCVCVFALCLCLCVCVCVYPVMCMDLECRLRVQYIKYGNECAVRDSEPEVTQSQSRSKPTIFLFRICSSSFSLFIMGEFMFEFMWRL